MAKKVNKKSTKRVLKNKPKELKPKKKHWATKLKEERNDLETKLFQLYRLYKGESVIGHSTAVLLDWLRKNERVNHMTIQRNAISVTGTSNKINKKGKWWNFA